MLANSRMVAETLCPIIAFAQLRSNSECTLHSARILANNKNCDFVDKTMQHDARMYPLAGTTFLCKTYATCQWRDDRQAQLFIVKCVSTIVYSLKFNDP